MRIDTNEQHPASLKKKIRYNRSNSAFNSRLRQRKLKERRYRFSSLVQLSEDCTFLFLTQNQHQLVNIGKKGARTAVQLQAQALVSSQKYARYVPKIPQGRTHSYYPWTPKWQKVKVGHVRHISPFGRSRVLSYIITKH